MSGLKHTRVGRLHQSREQCGVRFSCLGFPETGDQAFHGSSRRDFSLVVPTDSVG
jgi:hypothetical protein